MTKAKDPKTGGKKKIIIKSRIRTVTAHSKPSHVLHTALKAVENMHKFRVH